ncbi:hypothetical protein BX264_5185 [Streptomyces sp. 2333.5]|nr:hypothetical protein BX264_5185 [Streptomyces sp. 2333.5]SEE87044.1 hypothetical protein SAMN05428942_5286 [Streptomyces sp. 2112.2]SOE10859.1 hypothetical protein SAMN06272775_1877 [Streptomyces sp. 2323.1]
MWQGSVTRIDGPAGRGAGVAGRRPWLREKGMPDSGDRGIKWTSPSEAVPAAFGTLRDTDKEVA